VRYTHNHINSPCAHNTHTQTDRETKPVNRIKQREVRDFGSVDRPVDADGAGGTPGGSRCEGYVRARPTLVQLELCTRQSLSISLCASVCFAEVVVQNKRKESQGEKYQEPGCRRESVYPNSTPSRFSALQAVRTLTDEFLEKYHQGM
jgi:hypothetical protein